MNIESGCYPPRWATSHADAAKGRFESGADYHVKNKEPRRGGAKD
jgi:hypothetical protein